MNSCYQYSINYSYLSTGMNDMLPKNYSPRIDYCERTHNYNQVLGKCALSHILQYNEVKVSSYSYSIHYSSSWLAS